KEMELLTREREEKSLMLSQITSLRNTKRDDRNCRELHCLLQSRNEYDSVIRERKALLDDLDKQILELEKNIVIQKRRMVKAKQAKSSKRLQKETEKLETHLHNLTVQRDTNTSRNERLREEIKDLQTQKAVFSSLYFKFHKKLERLRWQMDAAVGETTQARERQREDLERIPKVKELRSKDTVKYDTHMREQKKIGDWEARLKTFTLTVFTDWSKLEEEAKKKKALKAARQAEHGQEESIEGQWVAYQRLLELAEDGDVGRLLNTFRQREGKNLAYLTYAAELTDELKRTEQRVKDLQMEISALVMDQERAEISSLKVLKELEEKITKTTEEAKWCEERGKASSKVLGQLMSEMEALGRDINCSVTKTVEQLREDKDVDLNLVQFFSLVEKKINELLLMEAVQCYSSADGSDPAQPLLNPLLGTTDVQEKDLGQLYQPPPALDVTADVIDACELPLDHRQLRQLVLQSHLKGQDDATDADEKRVALEC
ncbi:CCD63 protein, partial [Halcyon senegalensis]|nr:CCD63 protein [Halcyon senegalensis]